MSMCVALFTDTEQTRAKSHQEVDLMLYLSHITCANMENQQTADHTDLCQTQNRLICWRCTWRGRWWGRARRCWRHLAGVIFQCWQFSSRQWSRYRRRLTGHHSSVWWRRKTCWA